MAQAESTNESAATSAMLRQLLLRRLCCFIID
jgi:hypothetical protein